MRVSDERHYRAENTVPKAASKDGLEPANIFIHVSVCARARVCMCVCALTWRERREGASTKHMLIASNKDSTSVVRFWSLSRFFVCRWDSTARERS